MTKEDAIERLKGMTEELLQIAKAIDCDFACIESYGAKDGLLLLHIRAGNILHEPQIHIDYSFDLQYDFDVWKEFP